MKSLVTLLLSAALWIVLLLILGAALFVAGTYVLFGHGVALVVTGLLSLAFAGLIARGAQ